MNIRRLLRKVEGPQPLCRVVSRANLGYWHPSTTDIILSGVTDSHPVQTIRRYNCGGSRTLASKVICVVRLRRLLSSASILPASYRCARMPDRHEECSFAVPPINDNTRWDDVGNWFFEHTGRRREPPTLRDGRATERTTVSGIAERMVSTIDEIQGLNSTKVNM